jgi:hypothetical protein
MNLPAIEHEAFSSSAVSTLNEINESPIASSTFPSRLGIRLDLDFYLHVR